MRTGPVDLVQQAGRRARLAALLGRLLLEEPGPDAAELVAGIVELEPLGRHDDELASDYERLLLREVPLFESVFRSDDGRRGGSLVAEIVEWYRRHDFDEHEHERWRVASPDHLGLELRFLGHLAAAEAAAWADDRPEEACRALEGQRAFLAEHLGQWGEVALAALGRRAGQGPYADLASAITELLAEESERLRPAPHHPGLPEVVADAPPRSAGPARIAQWLLAPACSGAFLDVDDLARAAASIRVPWRPSDARSQFRHVVEAAVDGGDLDALLEAVRPALLRWHASHSANEDRRDGDRRIWRRWRLQTEGTVAFIDRLVEGSSGAGPAGAGPVVVEVRGPTSHIRSSAAALVVREVARLEATASVSFALPLTLAEDLAALVEAGARDVLLGGPTVAAVVQAEAGDGPGREARHLVGADVVVRLVAVAEPVHAEVHGEGPFADEIRRAVAAVVASEPHGERLLR